MTNQGSEVRRSFFFFLDGILIGWLLTRFFLWPDIEDASGVVLKIDAPAMYVEEFELLQVRLGEEEYLEMFTEIVHAAAGGMQVDSSRLEGLTVQIDKR